MTLPGLEGIRGGGKLNGMFPTGVGLGPVRVGMVGAGLDGAGRAGIPRFQFFGDGGPLFIGLVEVSLVLIQSSSTGGGAGVEIVDDETSPMMPSASFVAWYIRSISSRL